MSMDNMSKRARKHALRRHARRQDERTAARLIIEQLEEAADEAVERMIEARRRELTLTGYNPDTGKSLTAYEFDKAVARLGALTEYERGLKDSTLFNFEYATLMQDEADIAVDTFALV